MKLTPIFLAAGLLNVSVLATPLSQSKTPAQPAAHGSGHGSSSGNAPKGGSGSSTRGGSSSGTRGGGSSGTRGGSSSGTRGGSSSGTRGGASSGTRGGSSSGTRGGGSSGTRGGGSSGTRGGGSSSSGQTKGGPGKGGPGNGGPGKGGPGNGGSGTPTTKGPVKGTATPKGPVKSTATPKGRPSRTSSAAPAITSAEERFPKFYTCSPKVYGTNKIKTIKVDAYKAKVQAGKAGLTKGKSGDPHRYYNGEGLKWDFHGCDDSLDLWEYPVFAIGDKQDAWQKDTKTNKQEETAIRAVSANMNGGAKFCGVMVHELISVPPAAQGTNAPPFIRCTPSY